MEPDCWTIRFRCWAGRARVYWIRSPKRYTWTRGAMPFPFPMEDASSVHPMGAIFRPWKENGEPKGGAHRWGHKPATHPDPRAQRPHAHVPGVTNPDGTPWLP